MKNENVVIIIMVFLFLFSFTRFIFSQDTFRMSIIFVVINESVKYKSIDLEVPKGTNSKGLLQLISKQSLGIQLGIRFIEENGKMAPDVHEYRNGGVLDENEENDIIKPRDQIKFIYRSPDYFDEDL